MIGPHFLTLEHLTAEELHGLLTLSADLKASPGDFSQRLKGRSLAMIFQKPSTRTRVSFQVGMWQLGGYPLVLGHNDLQLGRGEPLGDTAQVLSRYVDGVMARVLDHEDLLALAQHATVPIINGLSDRAHPCQAVCDMFTAHERFGSCSGLRMVYLGDSSNNVAFSLVIAAAKLGVHLVLSSPTAYGPASNLLTQVADDAKATGAKIEAISDPKAAIAGAKVVYTDVWTSMGQEEERANRMAALSPYQVTPELMSQADDDAIFLHCLPAERGREVATPVIDGPQSAIFDQAENRLHTQKAILLRLLAAE